MEVRAAALSRSRENSCFRDKTAPVVWRGPKKASIIGQFIRDVAWHDDLDWLVVDTPPGTSDEHLAVTQELKQVR